MSKILRPFKLSKQEFDKMFFVQDCLSSDKTVEERVFWLVQDRSILRKLRDCGWIEWAEDTFMYVRHWGGSIIRSPHIQEQIMDDFFIKLGEEFVYFTTAMFEDCNRLFVCVSRGKTMEEAVKNFEENLTDLMKDETMVLLDDDDIQVDDDDIQDHWDEIKALLDDDDIDDMQDHWNDYIKSDGDVKDKDNWETQPLEIWDGRGNGVPCKECGRVFRYDFTYGLCNRCYRRKREQ